LNGFERNAPVTPLGDPCVKDFLVSQALNRADRQLKKLSGFAVPQQAGVDREAMHVLFEKLQFSVNSRHTNLQTHTLTFI